MSKVASQCRSWSYVEKSIRLHGSFPWNEFWVQKWQKRSNGAAAYGTFGGSEHTRNRFVSIGSNSWSEFELRLREYGSSPKGTTLRMQRVLPTKTTSCQNRAKRPNLHISNTKGDNFGTGPKIVFAYMQTRRLQSMFWQAIDCPL